MISLANDKMTKNIAAEKAQQYSSWEGLIYLHTILNYVMHFFTFTHRFNLIYLIRICFLLDIHTQPLIIQNTISSTIQVH